jgi:glycosyltransferase involved in cell wall biosynthesis
MDADFVSWAERNLCECDVLIALSGSGLLAGREIHRRGGAYICDRGSAHIRWVEDLLREEFKRWRGRFNPTDAAVVEKEEREYEEADLVVVPSQFAANSFVEMGVDRARVRAVPLGVEMGRFSPVGRPPADSFQVLFVGQVSFQKGVPYLLEAFSQLSINKKRLTIIGTMRPEMKLWLSGRHFEDVEFLGALPQRELPRYMSRSHVHVLPSIQDGFGMVVTQSMACGCPQIVSEHCGAADVLTDGVDGFIVPIRSASAIREKLEIMASDPAKREAAGSAAIEKVKSLGGWDSYGEAMTTLILDVCRRVNVRAS